MNDALADTPRVALAHLPTPLEPLERLSRELGGPRIWLKRDDCTGLATGGNKVRKLEYLLAEALEANTTDVVTFGAVQSNHARQTAAACAKLGLTCHIVLSRRVAWPHPAYEQAGNPLLDRLAGAQVHIKEPDEVSEFARALIGELKQGGKVPYVIPSGGSNATGALGYVNAAFELQAQLTEQQITPKWIVHASASAGTQAGLVYGLAQLDTTAASLGVNVYHERGENLETNVRTLVGDLEQRFGKASTAAYHYEHRYLGDGYGMPTRHCIEGIRMMASMEGVYFDPVYSGKALGALIDLISVGELCEENDIILLHTGGTASLAVYETAF